MCTVTSRLSVPVRMVQWPGVRRVRVRVTVSTQAGCEPPTVTPGGETRIIRVIIVMIMILEPLAPGLRPGPSNLNGHRG
jgi:hypothetical protein